MVLWCERQEGWDKSCRIKILECRSLDSQAVIPAQIEGEPVTELSPYLFSDHKKDEEKESGNRFWWSDAGGRTDAGKAWELPVLKGDQLKELHLPPTLKKVGAYGFYNCDKIEELEVYSTTLDWGVGVFTGCKGIRNLTIHVDEGQKSCMKELLSELRQTLFVTYLGEQEARLIFSEFFEEAVENTPARILVTNTHGCGKRYRNAFVDTRFQFKEYDSLFPHIQVQEPEELAARMALGRLICPCQLTEKYEEMYKQYLEEHKVAAACQAVKYQNMEELRWMMEHISYDAGQMEQVIEAAGTFGQTEMTSYLMEEIRKRGNRKRRTFRL